MDKDGICWLQFRNNRIRHLCLMKVMYCQLLKVIGEDFFFLLCYFSKTFLVSILSNLVTTSAKLSLKFVLWMISDDSFLKNDSFLKSV